MTSQRRIFLIGPMGAGKTTIGKRLAKALKFRFIDADHELERRTGAKIALIFDIEGEAGFRQREQKLLEELTREDGVVLATGGGAVLSAETRAALASRGLTVYLHAELDELLARTRNDTARPLLQGPDRAEGLLRIVTEREPLYAQTAHLTIDTGRHPIAEIVATIKQALA
jgi:shikimate kinase